MKRIVVIPAIIVIISLFVLFNMPFQGFALPDYSKIKGDFKIINIGDTRAQVLRKLNYLESQGEIHGISGTDQFQGEALEEKIACSLRYHLSFLGGERVRQIIIDFTGRHATPGQFEMEVKEYARYLRSTLEKVYGPPTYVRPYLFVTQLKPEQEKYLVKWISKNKIIGVVLVKKPDFIATQIIISSRLLEQELQKDEIQDFN